MAGFGMEALGAGLGDVTAHAGGADAGSLAASAFTGGSTPHLGPPKGEHGLAHEAAHMVQQPAGKPAPLAAIQAAVGHHAE